jgi:hypothetical protein
VSNTYRAEQLLRRVGVIPDDLSLAQADPRWPAVYEKLRLVEAEIDEAERRGYVEREREGKFR